MTFNRLKCISPRLSIHLNDLGGKIIFHFEFGLKVEPFQLVHPKWPSFLKYFLCLGSLWCIYLYCPSFAKDDKQYGTNFWEGETFSCPHNIKPF